MFSIPFDAEKTSFRASKRLRKFSPWKLPKIVNCATIKETEKLKETIMGSKWNRRVATNILLDHSSPFRKQWSPLHWVPPWDEETSAELGPWWATFPSEGVGLLWQLNIAGSSASGFSWCVCPYSNQLWLVPCSRGLTLLVWVVLPCMMFPIEVKSRAKGGLHWTLGADQGMVEYWDRRYCPR